MELQYISDDEGKPTAVIIPIDEWNRITDKHGDLKDLVEGSSIFQKNGTGQFRGILTPEEAALYHDHIKQARGKWNRDI